jgi:hypothetical protein
MALQALWALATSSFLIYSQSVGPFGRGISSSQGLYLNTEKLKQNKHIYTPNIHVLSGTRTHDHSVRANEDSSCLRPFGYRGRHFIIIITSKFPLAKWFLPLRFSDHNSGWIYRLPTCMAVRCPFHPSWFLHLNSVDVKVKHYIYNCLCV